MYSNSQGDLSKSSINKDVHHEHTRRRGIQKYLRQNCYHRIEYITATFLATFMWRKPMNSAALAITIHRKQKKMSDEIRTQVRDQMTNKWRIKMIQRELYNVRDLP